MSAAYAPDATAAKREGIFKVLFVAKIGAQ